jgi:pseudouridine synthase
MRALAFTVLVASSAAWAQAFLRTRALSNSSGTDVCVTWGTRKLTYRMDAAGSANTPVEAEFTAIDTAFATWQALARTCSDFEFVRGPRIMKPAVGKGAVSAEDNVVTFREANCRDAVPLADPCQSDGSCATTWACWDHGDATIALTTSTYSTRTGVVSDSDIEFNAGRAADGTRFLFTTISSPPCVEGMETPFCSAYDIQNTAAHEIGHMVGFDHVPNPASTMAPTAALGDLQKRVIDPGTASGFCGTYPKGKPPVPCDEQAQLKNRITARNTGTLGCSCTEGGGLTAVLAVWVRSTTSRMRLDKALQSQGFGSRKDCRALIDRGAVTVNGVVAHDPEVELETAGAVFGIDGISWPYREKLVLAMYKAVGVECSHAPTHHVSVFSLLPRQFVARGVQCVGRLDADTTGLLLLTDDGALVQQLTSPKRKVPKQYLVTTAEPVTDEQLQKLRAGVSLSDGAEVAGACERAGDRALTLAISEGQYHQVKRMLVAAGNHVMALHRQKVGGLQLPASLAPGAWVELTAAQLELVRSG